MKKHIVILILISFVSSLKAQMFFGSFGLDCYYQSGKVLQFYNPTKDQAIRKSIDVTEFQGIPGVGAYYYHALIKSKKHRSFGIDAGLNGSLYLSNAQPIYNQSGAVIGSTGNTGIWAFYSVPILASARFGRLSKNFSDDRASDEKKYGFAFGAGVSPLGFYLEHANGFKIMPEVEMEYFRNNTGLRFDLTIGKYRNYYKSETGDIPKIQLKFFSLKLIHKFKYF